MRPFSVIGPHKSGSIQWFGPSTKKHIYFLGKDLALLVRTICFQFWPHKPFWNSPSPLDRNRVFNSDFYPNAYLDFCLISFAFTKFCRRHKMLLSQIPQSNKQKQNTNLAMEVIMIHFHLQNPHMPLPQGCKAVASTIPLIQPFSKSAATEPRRALKTWAALGSTALQTTRRRTREIDQEVHSKSTPKISSPITRRRKQKRWRIPESP